MNPTMTPEEAADRLAIRELIDAYAHCADRRDASGQMALFTEDTAFHVFMDSRSSEPTYVLHGRSALAPVFADLNQYQATTHFNGQSTIRLDGDGATGESYCIAHHVSLDGDKRTLMIASIRYLDKFVKQDGAWLFAERKLMVDWTETRSSAPKRGETGKAAAMKNRQVWLCSRPNGIPQPTDFALREAEVPRISDGEFLVRNIFLSADPAMRGWIADKSTYWPRIEVGDTMRAFSVGEVIESRSPGYAAGDKVMGIFGWQDYAAAKPQQVMRKVLEDDLPLSLSLGVLGLNGLTAYFGLLDVCRPKTGETVVVSTAAGGVGSAVGQIAKIKGCRTIGFAGGAEKVRQCIEEFGYDSAVDYKSTADLDGAIARLCPHGIDAFFDNTSGAIHDAVVRQINVGARIAICGTASYASWDPWNEGPRPERHLLVKRAIMQGFLTTDFAPRYEEAIAALAGWIRSGKLRYREDMQEGIEAAPASIAMLYVGENRGKLVIRL